MVIEVIAKVDNLETENSRTTNSFYHIFVSEKNVAPVLPQNYHGKVIIVQCILERVFFSVKKAEVFIIDKKNV